MKNCFISHYRAIIGNRFILDLKKVICDFAKRE